MSNSAFDYRSFPRKLNVGCGFDIKPGYLNVDVNEFHKPDLVADVTNIDVLPAGYYEEVFAYDVLEHIDRCWTPDTLGEWNRLLVVGGLLHLRVPNVLGLADLLRRPENQSAEQQEKLVQCLFGTQGYAEDYHRTTFTELLLREYLARTGFRVRRLQVQHVWLFEVVAEKRGEPELRYLHVEPAEFVRRCYAEILHREPDEGGLRFYVSQLETRQFTRARVVDIIADSEEAKARAQR